MSDLQRDVHECYRPWFPPDGASGGTSVWMFYLWIKVQVSQHPESAPRVARSDQEANQKTEDKDNRWFLCDQQS